MAKPDKRSTLDSLGRQRLLELAHTFELEASSRMRKDELVELIASSHSASFEALLDELKREELKDICRAHGLDEGGKEKNTIRDRILGRDPRHEKSTQDEVVTPQTDLGFATPPRPTLRAVLDALPISALYAAARQFNFDTEGNPAREELTGQMIESGLVPLRGLLEELPLDELRTLGKQYGLDGRTRTRDRFVDGILTLARAGGRKAKEPPKKRKTSEIAAVTESTQPNDAPSTIAEPELTSARASERTVLRPLRNERIAEIGRVFGVALNERSPKDRLIDLLLSTAHPTFGDILGYLTRDELRAACRQHGLPAEDRAREPLVARLVESRGQSYEPGPELSAPAREREATSTVIPRVGDIVRCRHRQYLVEDVVREESGNTQTHLVRMVCLDDDDPGRALEVFWELELGAQVIRPEAGKLSAFERIDEPRHFAAYLHAIKWNAITASDARLFQAPFRAGIAISPFQLVPLMKALELPRANMFIADDVGLGKTIEAGLVTQELLLRQRVEYVLVVCPASVCLQWRDEMSKRFGLHFEIHDRSFLARRRRERGFAVNPWATHQRFIISYPILRRPEYFEPLVQHLESRGKGKTLLILDEAHTVAPASASRYAVDSKITKLVREQLGPRFENRLFLSATPHNGHSNSFSALLEILDPQRFMRGVPVDGPDELRPVMVRRLKRDIKQLTQESLPRRRVVQIDLLRRDDEWLVQTAGAKEPPRAIGRGPALELELAEMLGQYTALVGAKTKTQRLVFVNLQKRLLSSIPAFWRTLGKHADTFESQLAPRLSELPLESLQDTSDDEIDPDDDAIAEAEDALVEVGSRALVSPQGRARELLDRMLKRAAEGRGLPDARVFALVDWIRQHQCPAAGFEAPGPRVSKQWNDTRILVFTESVDTKRWLRQLLQSAFRHTDRGEDRIAELHGAMPDELREEVQRAFNGPAARHPVRVLLATDAAREGVNLQGCCADLFHFDIPWNPARMEQRNGRIDRTLQPAPEVRCHYFRYRDRREDVVLEAIVQKVSTIEEELGSLGAVIQDRFAALLESEGIVEATSEKLAEAAKLGPLKEVAVREGEAPRADLKIVDQEIKRAAKLEVQSRKAMAYESAVLRDTLNVALHRLGFGELTPTTAEDGTDAFALPTLPASWEETLDSLRPARGRDEALWDWRKRQPQPVVFDAPKTMTSPRVHLHLHHPFVRRVMDLLLAQGFGSHDLQRVTVVRDRKADEVRVLAFGRLSLFGRGAVRLHDTLVTVVAPWDEDGGARPGSGDSDEDQRALFRFEELLTKPEALKPISARHAKDVLRRASDDFATMWRLVRDEADAKGHDAESKLAQRGRDEAVLLREILEGQRRAIERRLGDPQDDQLALPGLAEIERRQMEEEKDAMRKRLAAIPREMERETASLEALYRVQLRKLEPVGLVYLWPEGMA